MGRIQKMNPNYSKPSKPTITKGTTKRPEKEVGNPATAAETDCCGAQSRSAIIGPTAFPLLFCGTIRIGRHAGDGGDASRTRHAGKGRVFVSHERPGRVKLDHLASVKHHDAIADDNINNKKCFVLYHLLTHGGEAPADYHANHTLALSMNGLIIYD